MINRFYEKNFNEIVFYYIGSFSIIYLMFQILSTTENQS